MKLVIYRTRGLRGTGYRWTLVADNGRAIANGGQGYSRRIDMEASIAMALGGALTREWLHRPVGSPIIGEAPEVEAIPVEDRTR